MNNVRNLFLLMLTALALSVQAEIYKWVDADGTVHFTDSKPAGAAASDIEVQALPAATPQQQAAYRQAQEAAAAPKVELYITSWCPYCKKAMAFLRSNNIAFNAYDIEQDSAAAARKKQLDPNYSGVPLAVINGEQIRGFSQGEYSAALANKSP